MDTSVSSNKDLLAQFASQVARQPEAIALITPEETVSYGKLQQRVDRIAKALRALGIGHTADETCLVGLCMPRGVDAVCAMLGILKAGGAYLPIDSGYPLSLQQRMTRSADLGFLLVDSSERAADFMQSVGHVVSMPELYQHPQTGEAWFTPVPGERLFHVLYTSGSTDEPKGVCGTHAQMQARLEWLWQAFPLFNQDVCCQKTALHFVDASLEIFGTLLQGRPLLIAPDSHSSNPEKLLNLLTEHGVTRISLVVSQLRALLVADPDCGRRLPQLKLCIVSGERLTSDLVDAFRQAMPDVRLVNLYGCSEVPEISHYEILSDTELDGSDAAPIGYPISGTELHIVDEDLQEVKPGDVGELLVGSSLQAFGYLKRPEETRTRFIDNPFGGSQRLYRTGDRVRMTCDGSLLFAGRADDQVKVRGHRIEISAVEEALKSCDEQLEAVKVVVQEDPVLAENRSLVAFVTPASIDTNGLLARLRKHAPRHMQVQRILALDKLPSTSSGKIDRRKLVELAQSGFTVRQENTEDTQTTIRRLWKAVLLTDMVRVRENFFEVGGDSLRLAQLHQYLRESFSNFDLSLAELLEYPTVEAQVNYLHQATTHSPSLKKHVKHSIDRQQDIAVISMACRLPGAATPEDFWANLRAGIDSVSDFSDDELEQPDAQLRNDPNYVKSGAVLTDIADFDADFFGFTDKEAALLDPQQRLLLECAWEAMERAGIVPDDVSGQVGVYAGSSASSYFLNNIATTRPITEATLTEYQENLANDRNFLATRIAYRLQLTGPAINVQTACSTGLVAIHMACQGLRNGECDLALAGSIALKVPQKTGYLFEEGMIRSPNGRCRAFDAQAEGTLFSSGGGVILLKPLAAAQADGDPILAVIKGSAINNDGSAKVGYTAPSVTGQADVVEAALKAADVELRTIGYVEAHGTGTRLGDPIEIAALTRAYTRRGWTTDAAVNGAQHCAIGSVKTNIGHLDEAAGIAGFIKTVLALQHQEIPPSLHFHTPNPEIDFANSPFHVNTQLAPWPSVKPATPRRAGVSSFGMGGTNCHLVLEQAPDSEPKVVPAETITTPSHHLFALSAASNQALSDLVERYRNWLAEQPNVGLANVCATAATGRSHFPYRYTTIAASVQALQEQLKDASLATEATIADNDERGKIAFLFTGQGSQYLDMARQLYGTSAPFRASIDRCAAILDPVLPKPLLSVMFASAEADNTGENLLSQTQYTQPALFTVEFALAELWRSWGVEPDLVIGHSVGEYVAACVAGVFELEDALHIVAERGRLIQALPAGGGMLAVAMDEARVKQFLQPHAGHACIAGVNSPASTVISGELAILDVLAKQLRGQGVLHKHLDVSHAFHSASLEPMLVPFANALDKLRLSQPRIPLISNLTGDVVSTELTDPNYWVRHTCSAVRFADGVKTLRSHNTGVILEIGPSPALLGMVAEIAEHHSWDEDSPVLLPSLRRGQNDWAQLLGSLGKLYEKRYDINWSGLYQSQAWCKQVLPTTPFQRKRCWIEPKAHSSLLSNGCSAEATLNKAAQHLLAQGKLTEQQLSIVALLAAQLEQQATGSDAQEQWRNLLYTPTWQRLPVNAINTEAKDGCWVILADRYGIGAAVAAQAEAAGITIFLLYSGEKFALQGRNRWTINPADSSQFADFLQEVESATPGQSVQHLIYLWSLDVNSPPGDLSAATIMQLQQVICGGVLGLLPALNARDKQGVRLWLVTRGAQAIDAENIKTPSAYLNPLQATLWGLGRSFALEHPQAWGGLIDLDSKENITTCATSLWHELNASLPEKRLDEQVALRSGNRYVARLQQPVEPSSPNNPTVQADAAYLITGGLGALGLEIAEALASLGARHLILVSRSGVKTTAQRQRLDLLRQNGVTVQTPKLDIADDGQALHELFDGLSEEKGQFPLKGIIHAAGIIAPTPSFHPEWSRFSSVLQAKVSGSWNLHVLSRERGLDFFILFSSASSLLGLSGHADYAAANAFLDALAGYRRQLGLPALSISWGDWAGTGMAADTDSQDAMMSTGLGALPLGQARVALRQLIGAHGHMAMIRADWPRFIASFQAHQGLLSTLLGQQKTNENPARTADNHTDIRASLSTATDSEREPMLREHLTLMVGKVLGKDGSGLGSTANLLSLGFDSLMLIELRNQLRPELGLQIELPRMLQGPSIDELVIEANKLFNKPAKPTNTAVPDADNLEGEDQWTTIVI